MQIGLVLMNGTAYSERNNQIKLQSNKLRLIGKFFNLA